MLPKVTKETHRRFVYFVAAAVMISGFLSFMLYYRFLNSRCAPYVRFLPAPNRDPDRPQATAIDGATGPGSDVNRLTAVKDAFLYNYRSYVQYAWACDALAPVSKKGIFQTPQLGGFGAPILDSLSTMIIMDFQSDDSIAPPPPSADADKILNALLATSSAAADADRNPSVRRATTGEGAPGSSASPAELLHTSLNYTKYIDLTRSRTHDDVSLFELTIRFIGGLLSTFELLGSPPSMRFLVDQAETLARSLSAAFVHEIPYNSFKLAGNESAPKSYDSISIAAAGSLVLEWSRLAELTGNATYRDLVERTEKALMQVDKVYPGMPANYINPNTGQPTGGRSATFGPHCDSYYEVSGPRRA